ncbi:MAG: UDP-glucose--hexose-1-phosphate uridylyltransferase, partial [Oscillochloris sp.]|nr:UDP-glucose--hexose-1-phosphate uridylyltransferase [Oscillochloris sp.]
NPLTNEWVLVSPQRMLRPWHGQVEEPPINTPPTHDPQCYLCPGNERAGGLINPNYTQTFVFDNDFAALLPDFPAGEYIIGQPHAPPLLRAQTESGICRVICFSPRHDLTLAMLDLLMIRTLVDTWAEQTQDLGERPAISYVQIFENRGAMMGASNAHPHGQIWATSSVPVHVTRELDSQQTYYTTTGRTLLGDYLDLEQSLGERLVCANDHFVALVPFWAVWPFETLIISRRAAPDIPALGSAERDGLADILKQVTMRYDALFNTSFPYSMGFHQSPRDGANHPEWHLHAHFYPPLLRSATVRKFMVGFELLGEPQRDLTAEQAAARLRAVFN